MIVYYIMCVQVIAVNCNHRGPISHRPCSLPTAPVAEFVAFNARNLQSCQVEVVEFFESFPWSPEADAIRWGGVVAAIFPWSPLARSQFFTPHSVIVVNRDTHSGQIRHKSQDFLRKNKLALKFPQFREFSLQFRETWRSRAISGDSRKFRETWQVWI